MKHYQTAAVLLLAVACYGQQPVEVQKVQTGNILANSITVKMPTRNPGDNVSLGLTIGGIAGPASSQPICVDVNNNVPLTACPAALNQSLPEVDLYLFYGTALPGGSPYKCYWPNNVSAIALQVEEWAGVGNVKCGSTATGNTSPSYVSMAADDPNAIVVGLLSTVNQTTKLIIGYQDLKRAGNPQTIMAHNTVDDNGNLTLEGTFPNQAWAGVEMELLPLQ